MAERIEQPVMKQSTSTGISEIYKLFDLNSKYPIGARISRLLPIADIINLTRTCKAFSGLYRSLLPSQWNVDKRLALFVDDVSLFRSQMAKYDALVTGSFALQLFDRVYWPASDVDVNIRDGADAFEEYLCNAEGYKLKRSTDGENYNMIGVDKIRTLVRRPPNAIETQIQLCISHCLPVEQILTGFYSTHVVNFLSWNKAYALFPRPTFVEKKGYMLQKLDEHLGEHLAKYSQRGWRIQDVVWEGENAIPAIEDIRRVGDRHTWIIPLDTANIKTSTTPDFVLEYADFRLEKSSDTLADIQRGLTYLEHYEIKIMRVRAEVLKFEYLCGSYEWRRFLSDRVLRLTEIELFKAEPSLRAPNFRELIRDPASTAWESFYKSKRWMYYDKEIPKWYSQWRRMDPVEADGSNDAVSALSALKLSR